MVLKWLQTCINFGKPFYHYETSILFIKLLDTETLKQKRSVLTILTHSNFQLHETMRELVACKEDTCSGPWPDLNIGKWNISFGPPKILEPFCIGINLQNYKNSLRNVLSPQILRSGHVWTISQFLIHSKWKSCPHASLEASSLYLSSSRHITHFSAWPERSSYLLRFRFPSMTSTSKPVPTSFICSLMSNSSWIQYSYSLTEL